MRCTCAKQPCCCKVLTNAAAAFMGPTVCELDGPKPILKISPMLIMVYSVKWCVVQSKQMIAFIVSAWRPSIAEDGYGGMAAYRALQ